MCDSIRESARARTLKSGAVVGVAGLQPPSCVAAADAASDDEHIARRAVFQIELVGVRDVDGRSVIVRHGGSRFVGVVDGSQRRGAAEHLEQLAAGVVDGRRPDVLVGRGECRAGALDDGTEQVTRRGGRSGRGRRSGE